MNLKKTLVGLVCAGVFAASCSGTEPGPGASSVKVVPHEKLLELLPTLPGWTRGTPQGSTDTEEAVSRVQVDYEQEGGIGGLSIEIMDTTGNVNILGSLMEQLKTTGTKTTSLGTTRAITIKGYPAMEEWSPEVKNGNVSVLVANRFTVAVTGSSLEGGVDVMHKTAEAIDLAKLGSLK